MEANKVKEAGVYCAEKMYEACYPLPENVPPTYQPAAGDFEHLAFVLGISEEEISYEVKREFERAYADRQQELEEQAEKR